MTHNKWPIFQDLVYQFVFSNKEYTSSLIAKKAKHAWIGVEAKKWKNYAVQIRTVYCMTKQTMQ